jgi:integral membrane protein (TIGR01906 family)
MIVTLLPSIWFVNRLRQNQQQWRLIRPFQWGMILPLIFGFLMAVGFDRFFVTFHEIFFSNDDWLFNPATDPIINVLPETFFMHCFILFFVLIEVFFFAFYWWGKRGLKKTA